MSVAGDQLDIFFVDSGIMELIPQVNVIPMPLRFIHFPFQAIECILVDIEPIDGDSKDRVIDELFRLAGDELNPNVFQSIVRSRLMRTINFCALFRTIKFAALFRTNNFCALFRTNNFCALFRTINFCALFRRLISVLFLYD